MKILNRKQFLALPSQTLYHKYKPQIFDNLKIKVSAPDEEAIDFCCDQMMEIKSSGSDENSEILSLSEKTGSSFDLNFEFTGRDGCFDDDQLFAVYEKKDILQLIERLKKCL